MSQPTRMMGWSWSRADSRLEGEIETWRETLQSYTVQASAALCDSRVVFLQLQGCVCWLLLAAAWTWARGRRRKALMDRTRSLPPARAPSETSERRETQSPAAPAVSLVMPVKGVHSQSMDNWRTIVANEYDGPLELIFVVDSMDDPAVPGLRTLVKEVKSLGTHDVRLQLAESATTCSQKIANQLAGLEAAQASSKYVLFLDDDIRLHPGTVRVLVDAMEADAAVLVATGYPLDIPLPRASFAVYCMMVYHLPLLVAFSHGTRSYNVWGGCMMLRVAELKADCCGMLSAYRNGGYSDDLILAAICNKAGRAIACPAQALFVNYMDPQGSTAKYWNYLRRQLFVLSTGASLFNVCLNLLMMVVHSYVSLAITLPVFTALPQLALAAGVVLSAAVAHGTAVMQEALLFGVAHSYTPPPEVPWLLPARCPAGLASAAALVVSMTLAGLAVRAMVLTAAELCSALSPHHPAVHVKQLSWVRVMWALLVNNLVLPVCALLTLVYRRIEWGGVVYTRNLFGRVRVVHRKSL